MKRGLPLALVVLLPATALGIPFIPGTIQTTLREELALARMVVYGTLTNAQQNPGGGGTVDLQIHSVIKDDPFLGNKKVITLPRYVPVDPQNPSRYVVFLDIYNGKPDPYKGIQVSPAIVDYLRGVLALKDKDIVARLLYFFRYLDAEAEIASDAFLEFEKAGDHEIAKRLDPVKLRRMMNDSQVRSERLALFAQMLGACGGGDDGELLRMMLNSPNEVHQRARHGILAGYIQLRPREGWARAVGQLGDSRQPFPERHAVLQTQRFFRSWKGDEYKREILAGMAVALPQGDLRPGGGGIADIAIEDLRKWQWWDLTKEILALYAKETHAAAIMRRAIVRYALCCPHPEAAEFIKALRKSDLGLVKDLEESLQYEKMK